MKTIIILSILVLFSISNYSQCPQPGLKIQSPTCNNPTNLKTSVIICTQLKLQWKGSQNQKYLIKATGLNRVTKKSYETNISKYSCDNIGDCQATIPVKEGTNVSWSVQGVCMQGSGSIYGYKVEGPQVTIPICENARLTSKILKAYPNPTAGNLIVEYDGFVTGDTKFIVTDVSGNIVFSKPGSSVNRVNNSYSLDFHYLTTGTYILKLVNRNEVRQVKFVLIKD